MSLKMKKRKGISLVEVMMAFVLIGFLVLMVSGAVTSSYQTAAALQKLPELYYGGQQEIEDKLNELEKKVTKKCLCEKELHTAPSPDPAISGELDELNEEQLNRFFDLIFYMIVQLVGYREVMSEEERYDEEAPMHDNAYERLVYNVAYQFHLETYDGLVNAYVWLLLGSLLRDEIIPVIYMYSSSFKRIRNMPSQDMTLRDRIHYVLFPDDYYPVYEGDDPDAPFADITFTCDRCGAELNSQNGFDPSRETFACKKCGYVNKLSWDEVYENEEDYENNRAVDEEQSREALRRRKEELES